MKTRNRAFSQIAAAARELLLALSGYSEQSAACEEEIETQASAFRMLPVSNHASELPAAG